VDAAATKALRAEMAAKRGAPALFDRGFQDIAELKSRCKAETGLEPPEAPRFQARTTRRKPAEAAHRRA
jgi:N-methylhydantoinase B